MQIANPFVMGQLCHGASRWATLSLGNIAVELLPLAERGRPRFGYRSPTKVRPGRPRFGYRSPTKVRPYLPLAFFPPVP